MGNYKQHLTLSTATGAVFAGFSWWPCGFPATTCLVAGGLCSIGGLLPDIDSSSSRSFRDYMWMTGSIASTLVANRLHSMEIDAEMIIFIGVSLFLGIRYGLSWLIKKFTVHRGIVHSIPAALISGELVYLLSAGGFEQRLLKAIGFALGFFSHLLLDEMYSITRGDDGRVRLKKSFGTALKFFNLSKLNVAFGCYIVLGLLTWLCFHQPDWMLHQVDRQLDHIAGWGIKGTEKFVRASDQAQQHLVNTSGIEPLKGQIPEQFDEIKSSWGDMFAAKMSQETSQDIPQKPPLIASGGNDLETFRDMDASTSPSEGLQSLFQQPRFQSEQNRTPSPPKPQRRPPERQRIPVIPMPPVQY